MIILTEGNSFTNLLKLMSEQGYHKDVGVTVGSVKSPKPLSVVIDEITLEEDDFIKSQSIQFLIDGVTASNGSTTVTLDFKKLESGDKVLILIDGHNFYVVDRVV